VSYSEVDEQMTAKHRNRLLFAAMFVVIGLGVTTGPFFASEGVWAGIGLFTLSAIAPAAVLGIVAYIWHGNDKEGRKASTAPRPLPRE
jgi:xanthine/uracil permease